MPELTTIGAVNPNAVATAAGILTALQCSVGFGAQNFRMYKTKSSQDVSMTFMVLVLMGSVMWTCYGLMSHLPSLWMSNGIGSVMSAIAIALCWRYRHVATHQPNSTTNQHAQLSTNPKKKTQHVSAGLS